MIIKTASFITSAVKKSQYPEMNLKEIAFVGRSNVGKSSLINCLLNRKKLVKISGKPGKTRLINFFLINDDFVFVDLPGFGYSKVSKKMKKSWGIMIEDYLQYRPNLKAIVFLIDIRREKLSSDEINLILWFNHLHIKTIFVLTKADKLSKNKRQKSVQKISQDINLEKEELIVFSAKTKMGQEKLWKNISRYLNKRGH